MHVMLDHDNGVALVDQPLLAPLSADQRGALSVRFASARRGRPDGPAPVVLSREASGEARG